MIKNFMPKIWDWNYEITFVIWNNAIIFGEFDHIKGCCYKQKFRLN